MPARICLLLERWREHQIFINACNISLLGSVCHNRSVNVGATTQSKAKHGTIKASQILLEVLTVHIAIYQIGFLASCHVGGQSNRLHATILEGRMCLPKLHDTPLKAYTSV